MPGDSSVHNSFHREFYLYYQSLCQYAFTLVNDSHACEDIVQETFLKVWEKRQDLIGKKELQFYLYVAVRNNCYTWLARRKKSNTVELVETGFPDIVPEASGEALSGKELHELVEEALQHLPPKCREVFVMSRISKLTYQQIADISGISIKTVENQMGKALRLLRDFTRKKRVDLLILVLYFSLALWRA